MIPEHVMHELRYMPDHVFVSADDSPVEPLLSLFAKRMQS
jgi:hypothetical protein